MSIHIIDVFRAGLKFPELKAKANELARLHGVQVLLIEDVASGQQLIQTLRVEGDKTSTARSRMPVPLRWMTMPWMSGMKAETAWLTVGTRGALIEAASTLGGQ